VTARVLRRDACYDPGMIERELYRKRRERFMEDMNRYGLPWEVQTLDRFSLHDASG